MRGLRVDCGQQRQTVGGGLRDAFGQGRAVDHAGDALGAGVAGALALVIGPVVVESSWSRGRGVFKTCGHGHSAAAGFGGAAALDAPRQVAIDHKRARSRQRHRGRDPQGHAGFARPAVGAGEGKGPVVGGGGLDLQDGADLVNRRRGVVRLWIHQPCARGLGDLRHLTQQRHALLGVEVFEGFDPQQSTGSLRRAAQRIFSRVYRPVHGRTGSVTRQAFLNLAADRQRQPQQDAGQGGNAQRLRRAWRGFVARHFGPLKHGDRQRGGLGGCGLCLGLGDRVGQFGGVLHRQGVAAFEFGPHGGGHFGAQRVEFVAHGIGAKLNGAADGVFGPPALGHAFELLVQLFTLGVEIG